MKDSATRAFSCLSGRKRSLFRLLAFFTVLFVFDKTNAQTTYYVNDAFTAGDKFCTAVGNNANSGLSPASPKFTVNDAMALAVSGDRILVDNGEYLISSLVISNGVKLVGADPDNTILRVQATGAPIQLASNAEIWNCKIFRSIPGVAGNPPTISLSNQAGSNNVRIENCFFFKNRTAIYLNWGNNITIARNRFDDNRTSIIVDVLAGTNYNDLVIRDNEIKNSRSYGILMFGPAEGAHTGYVKATIENNIITGNLAGGIEYNNTNASSQVKLRNNWFGVAPGSVDVNNMRTNGGFNVADHDGTGYSSPTFIDNGSLIGASYPNDLSGGNVGALTITTHAASAPMGAGPTLFVKSSNPAFDYYTNVQDAINSSNATATITIPDGTFREDVVINKALHVTGTTQAGTILKGLYYTSNANSVEIAANGASVNNLTVTRDFGTTMSEWAASTKNQGLIINANNDTVNNVLITGNRNGLYINNRQGYIITNNNIEQNRTGIQMGNDISNGRITNNKINGNFTHGLMLNAGLGPVNASSLVVKNNEIKDNWYTQIYLHGANTITSNAGTAIICNSYGTNQPTTNNTAAGEEGYATQVPAQLGGTAPATFATFGGTQIAATPTAPWLDNAVDAQAGVSGFQRATAITVTPVTTPLSAVNNDYRILANAIGCVESGNTITLNGTFDWTTTEAKAAWALGNNALAEGSVAAATTGSGDDYTISVPDANNVTLTSSTMGGATVQGPGDLANVALEAAIYFNSNKPASNFKNWTISKVKFNNLDVAVIADHNGGPLDVMEGLTITNNEFNIPADLNTTVAPQDNFQNIAVHLNYGKNQTISNNKFIMDGTGVSDSANLKFSTSVALQSATGGGNEYDGLKLQNNEVHVTGLPDVNPARIVGFWENSNNQSSAIDISSNTFVNDNAGNLADNNSQLALRITSFSGDALHQVVYQNNEISGFNRAFDFLGDPFSQYTPNAYYAAANPVIIKNNKVQDSKYGVTVRKDASSANTGSPAIVNNNSFKGIPSGGYAIANLATGANTDATCNYLDSPAVHPAANVTYMPWLNSGTDVSPAVKGFQPAPNTCVFPVHNITHVSDYGSIQEAIDAAVTLDGDIIVADAGLYREHLNINKNNLVIRGANAGTSGNSGVRVPESVLSAKTASLTQSLINLPSGRTVTFDGFTIADAEQIMANTSGSNTMTMKNNIIRDITSSQNTSGHNFYWVGGTLALDSNKVVFSGLNTDNNGGKSHFFIAGGSMSAKGNTFSSSTLVTPTMGTTARPVLFNLTSNLSQANIYNNVFDGFGLGMLIAGQASNLDIYQNDFRNAVEPSSVTSGAAIAFYEGFAPTGLINIHNNNFENSSNGIRTSGSAATPFPGSNLLRIRNNKFAGMTNAAILTGASFTGNLDALCNSFGTAAPFAPDMTATGNVVTVLGSANVNYRNWLVYGDNTPAALGFQTKTQYTVVSTGNTNANNNDYRLLSNAVGCAAKGDVVTLDGAFSYNNAPSQFEWQKGNDGNLTTTADNWSIVLPLDVDSVTLTGINNATVSGSGDLALANLEAFLVANNGHNAKWDINNLTIKDIDLAIGFQSTTTGASDSLQLHHNTIYIPKDLNAQVAPTDVNQNIGIILANGKGQQVNNNTIYVDATGISNGFGQKSTSVVLQSTTTGGTMYDGLKINDNAIHVTGVPNADTSKTAYILGIWENGHNKNADIQIYNNKFVNDDSGNLAANNKQLAFRVTSRSGVAKLVTYNHNEITGFNRGIEWIGDPFSTYGPYAYEADAMPVEIKNNKISNVQYGVSVRKDNASSNANAPAYINNNSFTSIGQKAIVYTATTGTVDASCNYFDAADINQVVDGNVSFGMFLNTGTNVAVIGFEPAPSTACIGRVHNVTQNTWYPTIQSAIDHPTTVDNDVIVAGPGTYAEDVVVNKSLDIRGNNYGISPNAGTRITESVIVPATSDIQNGVVVSIEKRKVSISGFTIDGDNTKINSGFTGVNSADLNTAEAIAVYANNIDSLTVKNNIIKNTSYQGITLYGATSSAPATTGHLIDSNLIKDLGTYDVASGIANWGGGVLLYNSQYARVTNNVMTNVRVGLQTGNFHFANPGNALYQEASGNTINARRRGIFHNLQTVNSSPYTISDNTINAVNNINEVAVWDGILAASLSTPSFLTNNTINGNGVMLPSRGVQVWNVKNTTPVNLSGGTISNIDIGIYANNYDGYNSDGTDGASVSVGSITISPKSTGTGMRIADNTASTAHAAVVLTVNNGVAINGGAKGVVVENANASAILNTLTLSGQSGNYIELINNAINIDATSVTFDGQTGATASLPQNFDIEDKVVHKIDEGVLGFVMVKDLHTFVTPLSFTANTLSAKVQRGVDAASADWTEHVKTGNYTDNVNVNKAMTIVGEGTASTKINSVTTNGNTITIAANNVTIKDLHVEGVPVSGSSATRGIYLNSTISTAVLDNVKSTLHQYAVYADNAANVDGLTVTNAELSNNGNGLGIEAQAKVSKLYVTGGTISNNLYGISSTANSTVTNNQTGLTKVSVTNVSLTGNQIKGMYFEKLDSAKIINNTLTGNGTSPSSPSGIDVNLKYGTYANIILSENGLTNNGTGAASGNGMTVKARNDGAYSTNVAALNGLIITNNEVSGSPVGIAIGNNVTASSINFEGNLISGASRGVVIYGMPTGSNTTLYHNSITASPTTIENGDGNSNSITATCNWLGSTNAATITSGIIGAVAYNPWLLDGTDATIFRGFQTLAPCNNRPTSVLTLTGDDTLCYGNSTTLSIALTGTAPWSVTYTDGTTPVTHTGIMTSPLVINVTPLATTSYTVTALNDNDYPALASDMTGSAIVHVTVAPIPSVSYATPFCKLSAGEAVTLTGSGAYTGGTFSAPSALTIDPVTGTINPSTSTPGTYTVSYTTIAAGGCPSTTAQTSVVVKNSWTANISGTTTVAQNLSTTATISFSATGTGGKAPYTFNYSVFNGTTTTLGSVTTTGTNTVVTVPQSNAVTGQFIYTLLSATDSTGCAALLAADTKDTITVTAGGGTTDLTPVIVVSNPSFTNTVTTRPYTLNIFNLGNAPTTGLIGIYIIKPNSGSSLTFDPAWTVSESPSYYYIESSSQTIPPNFGFISVTGNITVSPSVAPSNFSLQVVLAPGAGSDSVPGNNAKAVNLNKTN